MKQKTEEIIRKRLVGSRQTSVLKGISAKLSGSGSTIVMTFS